MAEITIPYPTFLTDTFIMPDEVNANFATLADQALNRYGGTIAGNITVAPGVTIDGVDISTLGAAGAATMTSLTLTGTTPNTLLIPNGGIQCVGLDAGTGAVTGASVVTSKLVLKDVAAAADARLSHLEAQPDLIHLYSATDAGVEQESLVKIVRSTGEATFAGPLHESARAQPLGHWKIQPYDALTFTADVGTWSVAPANQWYRYAVVGTTLFLWFHGVGMNISAAANTLFLKLPLNVGFVTAMTTHTTNSNFQGAWGAGLTIANANQNYVTLYKTVALGPWSPSAAATSISLQISIPFL